MILDVFKIAFCSTGQQIFMWHSLKVLKIFKTWTLKQVIWKTKTFFEKLEHCFLVESTTMENTQFSHKTALSDSNVKANRIESTN